MNEMDLIARDFLSVYVCEPAARMLVAGKLLTAAREIGWHELVTALERLIHDDERTQALIVRREASERQGASIAATDRAVERITSALFGQIETQAELEPKASATLLESYGAKGVAYYTRCSNAEEVARLRSFIGAVRTQHGTEISTLGLGRLVDELERRVDALAKLLAEPAAAPEPYEPIREGKLAGHELYCNIVAAIVGSALDGEPTKLARRARLLGIIVEHEQACAAERRRFGAKPQTPPSA